MAVLWAAYHVLNRQHTVKNARILNCIHLKKNCFISASKKRGGFFEFFTTKKYKHKKKHFIKHFFILPIFLEKKTISCCFLIFLLDCLVYTLFVIIHHLNILFYFFMKHLKHECQDNGKKRFVAVDVDVDRL